jgi:hypothetical protein
VEHRRPPTGRGSRRAIPRRLTDAQRERLRSLLTDPDTWVLRPDWERYLLDGDEATLVHTDELSRDHRTSVLAWLEQQRHTLHRVLEGGEVAPDGWVESLPLYTRLTGDPGER